MFKVTNNHLQHFQIYNTFMDIKYVTKKYSQARLIHGEEENTENTMQLLLMT